MIVSGTRFWGNYEGDRTFYNDRKRVVLEISNHSVLRNVQRNSLFDAMFTLSEVVCSSKEFIGLSGNFAFRSLNENVVLVCDIKKMKFDTIITIITIYHDPRGVENFKPFRNTTLVDVVCEDGFDLKFV